MNNLQKDSRPTPVICFGQQPCGIFPKRFLVAKIQTAWKLRADLGGRIVFFYHDSDHDYRETQTVLTHQHSAQKWVLNFTFPSKNHKKYTPLYQKYCCDDWKANTRRQLPNYVDSELLKIFDSVNTRNASDFCLEMYEKMGWLQDIEVVRSSDRSFRETAIDILDDEHFVDIQWQGEWVRVQKTGEGSYRLHRGGNAYYEVPVDGIEKWQISPTRDSRLRWMQSVVNCTHYIAGEGEMAYLKQEQAPEITFVKRNPIDRSGDAHTEVCSEKEK